MDLTRNMRLLTLDAMRGLAAFAVVLFHMDFVGVLMPSGYLAVDFFFLMSGFVISRTYQTKLIHEMSFSNFFFERVIRLYPLYILGLAIGLLRCVAQILADHPLRMSWYDVSMSTVFNFFMLPSVVTNDIAPINGPAWSLFLELFVNLFWAGFLLNASKRRLACYVALMAFGLCTVVIAMGSAQTGWKWSEIGNGLIRSSFGFGLGALIAIYKKTAFSYDSKFSIIAMAALCIVLTVNVEAPYRAWYDLIAIIFVFPIILLIGVSFNPPRRLQACARALGDMSYPLYLLHFPALFTLSYIARKYAVSPEVWIPLFLLTFGVVSLYLSRTYDPRVRLVLKRIFYQYRAKVV